MADFIYIPPPTVNIDITAQTIGQWATLSKSQLSAVAGSFAKQAGDLYGSLVLWRISTVTSLAITIIAFLGAMVTHDGGAQAFCFFVCVGAGLWFLFSCHCWSDVSSKISNANIWHDRAIDMIKTAV